MAQIFCLAPSISPPMLPVVSRPSTPATFGFFTSEGNGAANDGPANDRTATAARKRLNVRRIGRNPRVKGKGTFDHLVRRMEGTPDCNGDVKVERGCDG